MSSFKINGWPFKRWEMSIQRFERGQEFRVSSETRRNLRCNIHSLKNAPKLCLDMVHAWKTGPSPPTKPLLLWLLSCSWVYKYYLGCKLEVHVTTTTSAKKNCKLNLNVDHSDFFGMEYSSVLAITKMMMLQRWWWWWWWWTRRWSDGDYDNVSCELFCSKICERGWHTHGRASSCR